MSITPEQREARKIKRALKELTQCVIDALALLDKAMKEPPSVERGKHIARVCNWLDNANDLARMSLGVNVLRTRKRPRPVDVDTWQARMDQLIDQINAYSQR